MRVRVRSSTCCMPRVLFAERAEWVSGTIRSCWPARETAQVRCASDVTGDFPARVAGELHTLAHVGNPSKVSAVCDAQGDDKAARIARWKGRTGKLSTAALAVKGKKKKASLQVHSPVFGHRSIS